MTQPVFDLDLLEAFPEAHRAYQDSGDLRHLAADQLPQRRIHGERAARARSRRIHGAHARARKARKRRAPKASPSRGKWWRACAAWCRACS